MAYGMADRDDNVSLRTDAIFRLASVSNLIATVAVIQMREEGHGARIVSPKAILVRP
jgi:CubicO group peptidase (beta-lactamase class C family)